ncbi:MAG: AmmeMemoRadiSam system protein B [candidate division WOR-3 bacterium]
MAQTCNSGEYRESIHAGSWYPGREKDLQEVIKTYLKNAKAKVSGEIFGLVSPHAGYMYSGPFAAFSYKLLENKEFDDVIVIGPSHRHGFYGVSVDKMPGRETPLGKIEFDKNLAESIIKQNPEVIKYVPNAHAEEHSVEIQIPFLQVVLKKFKLVEIVMGSHDYNTCKILADAIVNATKGRKVLVIASSDLSHYHNQEKAEKLDNLVIDAIEKYDPELLYKRLSSDSCEACGGGPIITVMLASKKLGADKSRVLIYGTSGNVTGDYTQVVGYLSAAFFKGQEEEHEKVGVDLGFTEDEKKILKDIARKTIEAVVKGKKPPEFKELPEKLKEPYGVFVTITKHGNLRGCIGHIIADEPLYKITQEMAKAAALHDPRFNPVNEKELSEIEIEISVLTPMEKVKDFKDIVIGRDGLLVRRGYYSGLLLPQVATDYGWTVEEFLEQTCVKAGLPEDAYKMKDTEVYKFSAQIF